MNKGCWICLTLFFVGLTGTGQGIEYYGTKIGKLNTHFHDVVGDVFAVDDKRLFVKGFSYDGAGPDAFFWAGTTIRPDATGFIIPDENGSTKPLKAYRNKDLLLKLPEGKSLKDIKWIAVWCRKFNANFGDLIVPRNLHIPRPTNIGKLSSLQHGVSSGNVMVLDSRTLLVPDFTYDGQGPAAYWWVSNGQKQNAKGLRLKDENGSGAPLTQYTGKTVVITLPEDKTIYDFDWLGVWCEEFNVDFGSIKLPHHILVPPSSITLGVKTDNKLNCEILFDDLGFELRWVVDKDDIIMQLVAKLDRGEYMSFGLSKNDTHTKMVGADAIVAWMDDSSNGHAVDYFLESKQQCVGNRGVCPDSKHKTGTDNVSVLNSAVVNGYTMIMIRRPQLGVDPLYDQHIYSDGPQAGMWAIGPINNKGEPSYHSIRTIGNFLIDFFRPPSWNCPEPGDEEPSTYRPTEPATRTTSKPEVRPWDIPPIVCPSDQTFRAQIGPTGGKKGYQAITGNIGWGIAWYINGYLVPELTVQRGKTYTFLVEGGHDPQNPSRHHPLYITDDLEGGYEYKSATNREKVNIFAGAGIDQNGKVVPTAAGRLCEWKVPKNRTVKADEFNSFREFQSQLYLQCEPGKAAIMKWRPDHNTPNLVYYQCFTHRFLGWKIHVVDSCDEIRILEPLASGRSSSNITYNSNSKKEKTKAKTTPAPPDYEIIYYDYVDTTDNKTLYDIDYDVVKVTSHQRPTTATPITTKLPSQETWPSAVHLAEHVTTNPTLRYTPPIAVRAPTTGIANSNPRQHIYQTGFVPLIIRANSTWDHLLKHSDAPALRYDNPSSGSQPRYGERLRKPNTVPLLIPNSPHVRREGSFKHSALHASNVHSGILIPDGNHQIPSKGPLVPMLMPLPSRDGDKATSGDVKPRPLIPLIVRTHPNGTNYSILDHVLSLISEDKSHPDVVFNKKHG